VQLAGLHQLLLPLPRCAPACTADELPAWPLPALQAGGPISKRELDSRCEQWLNAQLAAHTGASVDFEVTDALGKLRDLGIMGSEMGGDGKRLYTVGL
jgi:hypothetical protein